MKIETFVTGIIGTNTYVAYNETTKEAVLVDPHSQLPSTNALL